MLYPLVGLHLLKILSSELICGVKFPHKYIVYYKHKGGAGIYSFSPSILYKSANALHNQSRVKGVIVGRYL